MRGPIKLGAVVVVALLVAGGVGVAIGRGEDRSSELAALSTQASGVRSGLTMSDRTLRTDRRRLHQERRRAASLRLAISARTRAIAGARAAIATHAADCREQAARNRRNRAGIEKIAGDLELVPLSQLFFKPLEALSTVNEGC